MNDTTGALPSSTEVAELSRWAQVAMAVRCARFASPIAVAETKGQTEERWQGVPGAIAFLERLLLDSSDRALQTTKATVSDLALKFERLAQQSGPDGKRWAARAIERALWSTRAALYGDDYHVLVNAMECIGSMVAAFEAVNWGASRMTSQVRSDFRWLLHHSWENPLDSYSDIPIDAMSGVPLREIELSLPLGPLSHRLEPVHDLDLPKHIEEAINTQAIPVPEELKRAAAHQTAPDIAEEATLQLYIEACEGDEEDIAELLRALSEMHIASGGMGLNFRAEGIASVFAGVQR